MGLWRKSDKRKSNSFAPAGSFVESQKIFRLDAKKIQLAACERVELLWKEGDHLLAALARANRVPAFQWFVREKSIRRVRAEISPQNDCFLDSLIGALGTNLAGKTVVLSVSERVVARFAP